MKKAFSLLPLILLFIGLLCGCGKQANAPEVGEPILAAFTAVDMEGTIVDQQVLADHKLTMVNIWATFCGPCIREMPDLAALNGAYGDDFQIIGIVIDATDKNLQVLPDAKAEAQEIIRTTDANYLHLLPSQSLNKAYLSKVQAVPETFFVDTQGRQIGESYVGSKTKVQWQQIIESLLDGMK